MRSLVKGYFVYLGNRKTVKAAGYVKELCLVAIFSLDMLRAAERASLLINFTMDPPPSVEAMVDAILKVIGTTRRPLNVPPSLLIGLSYPLLAVERVLRIKFPINVVRVRKLIRSNNIWPMELKSLGYKYKYTMESSFRDWKHDVPEDFCR